MSVFSLWICLIYLPISFRVASLASGRSEDWSGTSEVILNYHHIRHNERDGVSNHRRLDCLPFVEAQIKENIKALRHWWPVDSPPQKASNVENIFIWWRHHDIGKIHRYLITSNPDETLAVNKFLRLYCMHVFIGVLQPFSVFQYQTLCALCVDKNRFGDLGPTKLAIGQFVTCTKLGKRGDAYTDVVHTLK